MDVAEVVAHELAHQWFGNLVTPKWWTDIWLNEGFATYVAGLGVHAVHPEWKFIDQRAVTSFLLAFELDALESSHPVSVPIRNPAELSEIFDIISYEKGSFLIRMMSICLGQSALQKGLSRYLNQFKFDNAEQNDLWDILTKAAKEDESLPAKLTVKEIMDSWTKQTGFPVVTVTRQYNNTTAELVQKRFWSNPKSTRDDSIWWWVPVSYTAGDSPDFTPKSRTWIFGESTTIEEPPEDEWLFVNTEATGFFKVNYDRKNWELLTEQLYQNHRVIPPVSRALLLDDAFDLAAANLLDYTITLDLTAYLVKEKNYLPWLSALSNMAHLNDVLLRTPVYGLFRKHFRSLITPLLENEVPLEREHGLLQNKLLQNKVKNWACTLRMAQCEEEVNAMFARLMTENYSDARNEIPVDIRETVYCTAIRLGNESSWDFVWQRYVTTKVTYEKEALLKALACTEELWIIKGYLEKALSGSDEIRSHDIVSVFDAVTQNPVAYDMALQVFIDRFDTVIEKFGSLTWSLGNLITNMFGKITENSQLLQVRKFVEENKAKLVKVNKAVTQGLETAESNVQWKATQYKSVRGWLEAKFK